MGPLSAQNVRVLAHAPQPCAIAQACPLRCACSGGHVSNLLRKTHKNPLLARGVLLGNFARTACAQAVMVALWRVW